MAETISEHEILQLLHRMERPIGSYPDPFTQEAGHEGSVDARHSPGLAGVRDGVILVEDPGIGERAATVEATWPIRLTVGGKIVKEPVRVTSGSRIEWALEQMPMFEISVSKDGMEAMLTVHELRRHAWMLTDQPMGEHLVVRAEENQENIVKTIGPEDVLAELDRQGIRMNLDMATIHSELLRPAFKPLLIARGKPPVPGQDARLDLFFSEKIESLFTEVKGQVDFKNHMNIPSVKSGDVIAKKEPAVEGEPGYDVFGQTLLPRPAKDIRILARKNVEITPESIVIARQPGRPRVTGGQIKYFDINTAFIVPGDVDMQTGNIVFAGDVIVYGDVQDNMIIESLGNIYVSGSVFNATLTATGSIAVKGNVIGARLYSGYFGILYNRFYTGSKDLLDILTKMKGGASQLLQEVAKKNLQVRYGQVLILMMESKYGQTRQIVSDLLGVITSIQLHDRNAMELLKQYMEMFLSQAHVVTHMTEPKLERLIELLNEAHLRVALSQESQVRISVGQGQQAVFKSNGDILIRREGIIQCDLYSAGSIGFTMEDALCRGSRLEAGERIAAGVVGGEGGAPSTLKAGTKISVKKMYAGKIAIDRSTLEVLEPIGETVFDRRTLRRAGQKAGARGE
ncbi:DUF342 domain-containing protein [Paenibacillus sp. IB182496]|uniref:DUF342 domain-containing protein n=1 Tax=Paenibacillus sabuli TaxID=2772509 RepID=A0A927BXT2_9BACL|nr:FapA family protein [Paenibacillus sabuli]MBD2847570.1 DUF342 domain-containing protein [Paenibacillus sabuli]